MRKAAKADDAKTKQTAAEGFLEAAMIVSPDADVQAQVEIANALADTQKNSRKERLYILPC